MLGEMGLDCVAVRTLEKWMLKFHPHPYGMRLQLEGLSHGCISVREMGLDCVAVQTLEMWMLKFHPHPYGMRLQLKGLSHGLKTCHRHVFLTAFRVLSCTK